ncbi:MAG TPA: APC family permease [Actinomycetota bacterium]|nr:APC family permease [Actinomycetota bacterium]
MATEPARTDVSRILKRILVGRALATHKLEHQLLPKRLALPVFASDQLSSVSYATEQMMLVLILAGAGAIGTMVPLGIGVAVLLVIVIASYRQTCRAYPRGGGSYIVAKDNLGTVAGLVAAAAIQTSYVLTVAVSVTAGAIAVTSAAPSLAPYKLPMALAFVGLITMANLRGAREAGRLFAIPTYGFVAMVFVTLATGAIKCLGGCPVSETASLPVEPETALTAFVLLRAFSSGATALTGVEAIADGVQAFRRPQAKNAAATLTLMGAMSIPMFIGITFLARVTQVRVNEEISHTRSVLSLMSEAVFGRSLGFWLLQGLTAAILVLAANTAYQDFPRLASILARDRFMPSQFRNRGDRLVFSNGVVALAVLSAALVWLFNAELSALIHLYVVGVFTAITLSQAGMVRRWLRLRGRDPAWRRNLAINGVGAAVTGMVLAVIAITQFALGAWIVITAIPVIVLIFLGIHRHYERVAARLTPPGPAQSDAPTNHVVVLIPDLGLPTAEAVGYLHAVRPRDIVPLYTGDPEAFADAALEWPSFAPRLGKLERLADDKHSARAIRRFLRELPRPAGSFVTIVVPERVSGRSLLSFIRGRSSLVLKASLLFEPDVVVTNIPLLDTEIGDASVRANHPVEIQRSVVLVPVSAVTTATMRAVTYARSLHATLVEAVAFSGDPEEVQPLIESWSAYRMPIPLSLIEDSFREISIPLLQEIRKHTERPDTVVTVVMPEFVVDRWWQNAFHNQTGLYLKRLLLFEPSVVVTSVPFHLGARDRSP